MSVWHLVWREIAHRKGNFLLALLSVTAAVGSLIGATTLLEANSLRTRQLLDEKEQLVEKAGAQLEDAMRKITIGLGFNVLILPEDQDLAELHAEGTLSKAMPYEYVDRLAKSRIVTVNHLLPAIVRKLRWDEQDMTIVLMGTRGEVPFLHKDPKKPMLDAVPRGKLVAGYHVHRPRNLNVGDRVTLLGKEFDVLRLNEERGSVDDTTVWVHLEDAQEMLGMQNLINGIWALECHCTGDRISQVRAEISSILPGTQVIERGTQALARAEARSTAKLAAEQSLEREAASRAEIRGQQERFAAVLVPLIVTACAVWVAFLTYGNVRQRREEIGILRAIGLRSSQILALFLSKAVLVALFGAVAGYLAGFVVGLSWSDLSVQGGEALRLFSPGWLLTAIAVALLLSCLASWLPAIAAARQDPAVVFQQE